MTGKQEEYQALVADAEKVKKKSRKTKLEDGLFEEFRLFGLPLPERQYHFHPTRQWRVDFAWPTLKVMVEVQGGIFIPAGAGGHNRGAYMEKEYEKSNEATRLGWAVYKFGPKACYRPVKSRQASAALSFMYQILGPHGTARDRTGPHGTTPTQPMAHCDDV